MKTALLIIDIQNDYFPNGKMELENSTEAGNNAGKLLSLFREKKNPIINIQHISTRSNATFFLPKTIGAEIHECVKPIAGEFVMQKHYPNSFRDTVLLEYLRGNDIDSLIICGMMTHMCVDTTVRAAADYGFTCTLAGDACATRALSFNNEVISAKNVHNAFLAALNGAFAKVISTDQIISDLLK